MSYRQGPMTPLQMLKTVAGICKTNGKIEWKDSGLMPEAEFRFIANMIEAYIKEQDKGSQGANQHD